jgi:hypothetical protein
MGRIMQEGDIGIRIACAEYRTFGHVGIRHFGRRTGNPVNNLVHPATFTFDVVNHRIDHWIH